jgi:hypothetical protein
MCWTHTDSPGETPVSNASPMRLPLRHCPALTYIHKQRLMPPIRLDTSCHIKSSTQHSHCTPLHVVTSTAAHNTDTHHTHATLRFNTSGGAQCSPAHDTTQQCRAQQRHAQHDTQTTQPLQQQAALLNQRDINRHTPQRAAPLAGSSPA